MKKNLRFILIIVFTISAFIFSPNSLQAQGTVATQNFDNAHDPPDNMTEGIGNSDWIVDDGTVSGIPGSSGYAGATGSYFLLAADLDGANDLETITYTVSARAFANLKLQWGAYTSNDIPVSGTFPPITLSYSTNGVTFTSVAYTEIATNDTWGLVGPVSLPAGASNATILYLRWSYNSDGNAYFYAIDDIQVSGTVNAYFSKVSGNLDLLSTWGTNFDGTGSAPPNFTSAGITYEIINNPSATIGAAWTVSGAGSKILVGDSITIPTINFTIPSGFVCTGTVAVQNNGTLTLQNTTPPTFGTLFTGSTVNYAIAGAQNIVKGTYSNLTISGSGTKTAPNFPVKINGTFNISAGIVALSNNLVGVFTINGPIAGAGTISGAANAQLNILGSSTLGTIAFTPGFQSVSVLKINRSGVFTLTLGSDVTVTKTFEHDNSGILDLNGHTFTVNGTTLLLSTTGNATISGSSTSNLSIKATGATTGSLYMTQTSTATSSLSSLILNSSLTLANNLNIIDSIVPRSGTLTSGGNLTLIADQTTVGHAGRIGVVVGSITGNIVSQVYHSPNTNNTDWRNLGVAGISNATFSAWSSQFPMTCPTCPMTTVSGAPFSSITTYAEPTETYPDITYGSTIVPGTGYWVYLGSSSPGTGSAPFLISVTGIAQTGNVTTASLTNSDPGAMKGYNLVANPYASPISFTKLKANHLGIDNVWYTYSPAYGDNAAWVGGISTPAYSHGSNGIDATIPAGMGFFVHANAPGPLTFIENLKVTGSNEVLLKESNPSNTQSLLTYFRMQVNGNGMMNEAVVRFDANATTGFDPDYDLYDTPPGTPGWLQISTSSLGKAYAVNCLPALTQNYAIPVTITCATTGSYQFASSDLQNMPLGVCLSLHDNYLGVDHDLRAGNFNLTITDTETVSRFVLNVTAAALSINTNAVQATCSNKTNAYLTAVGTNAGPWNYVWKDAGTNNIVKTSLNKTVADTLSALNNGIYSVDVNTTGFCDNATQTFTLTAPAATTSAFTASSTSVNINNNITFTDNSSNATAYWWTFGDGNTSNMQNPIYAYTTQGVYTVTFYAINTACGDTVNSTKTITVLGTANVASVASNEEIIFSKDQNGAYVKFNYNNQTKVNINVYNSLGQVLLANASLAVVNDKIYLNLDNSAKDQMIFVSIANLDKNTQVTKKLYNN